MYISKYHTYYVNKTDLGFNIFTLFISKFAGFHVYLLIISSLTISFFLAGFWKLYKKLNINFSWCIVVFYITVFMSSMNIMRQYLGISIVCFALPYLIDGQYIKYVCFVALATLIHISSIISLIFILIHFFTLWKDNKITTKLLTIASIPIALVVGYYAYSYYLATIIQTKIEVYFSTVTHISGFLGLFQLLTMIFVILITMKKVASDETNREFRIMKFLSIILLIGSAGFLIEYFYRYMYRLFLVFNVLQCVYLGKYFKLEFKNIDFKNYSYGNIINNTCFCMQIIMIFYPFAMRLRYNAFDTMNYSMLM